MPLECPPGYALSRSAPPALDSSVVKRHIVRRRGLGWVKGSITRRAQVRTRQNHDYRVLIERTCVTLSKTLPLGKYTAVDEAAAEGAWVLLEKYNALSRMLQRELLAAPQGAGRGDIDGDGFTDCGKEDNEDGENGDKEGERRAGGEERMVTSKEAVWKRTVAVAVTVGIGKAPTKRGRGMTTRMGERTRVGAE